MKVRTVVSVNRGGLLFNNRVRLLQKGRNLQQGLEKGYLLRGPRGFVALVEVECSTRKALLGGGRCYIAKGLKQRAVLDEGKLFSKRALRLQGKP
eukprot:1968048-Amphidinium_carterae.1